MYSLLDIIKEKGFIKKFLYLFSFLLLVCVFNNIWKMGLISNAYQYWSVIAFVSIAICVPYGYIASAINFLTEKDTCNLPSADIFKDFKLGFKYFIALAIPLLLMLIVKILLLTINSSYYKSIENYFMVTIVLAIIILFPALTWIFANKQTITSYLLVNKALFLIKNNFLGYLNVIVIIFLTSAILTPIELFVSNFVDNLFQNDLIFIIVLSSFDTAITSVLLIIFVFLISKSIKKDYLEFI